MREVEKTGLITPNNTGPMNCSDPIGLELSDGKVSPRYTQLASEAALSSVWYWVSSQRAAGSAW